LRAFHHRRTVASDALIAGAYSTGTNTQRVRRSRPEGTEGKQEVAIKSISTAAVLDRVGQPRLGPISFH
jgi:hypothetical protein